MQEQNSQNYSLTDNVHFTHLNMKIASDEVIRDWSHGSIQKPETINYRTFKPEKGGLFCEKIFGPTRDWECACGKYKKIKNKGMVCDRCGVEVTLSKVRRERMAHIDLAVPVVHIWFFKSMPSRIGNVLGMSTHDLERIIYYEDFVVVDPGRTNLEKKQLLNPNEYIEVQEKWGSDAFVAKMGGEAIRELLEKEDLPTLVVELKEKLKKTKSNQARMKLAKRLKIVEGFTTSPNKPDWMVISVVPVLPPDLRPLVPLDGGRFATSDLNDLYRRVINRNNRLNLMLKLKTPDVIIRNEKRMLQEAVDALFDNGRHGAPVVGAGNRPLKALSEMLKGKQGRFRQNLLGKRVDYSGRSVIIVGPELKFNQCGLPKQMALELFEPFIVKRLKDLEYVYTIRSAKKMIQRQSPEVWDVLDEIIKGHPVLLNRAPTLHRLGIQAFEPVLIEGKAIRIHPLVCTAFNADFDGDQMAVHVPLSIEAQLEAKVLMMASHNIFTPSSGKSVAVPTQDMILGLYYLNCDATYFPEQHGKKTKVFRSPEEVLTALQLGDSFRSLTNSNQEHRIDQLGRSLSLHEHIKVKVDDLIIDTTPGRVIFNTIVPKELGFQNRSLRKKILSDLISEAYKRVGLEATITFLDNLKNLGFAEATRASLSMGVKDIKIPPNKQAVIDASYKRIEVIKKQFEDGIITDGERHAKGISVWTEVTELLSQELFRLISQNENSVQNPLFLMVDSGARGTKTQIMQLGALRGLMAKPSGEIIENPITSNFREGLSVLEYFISSHGARKGLADTALKTADSGYLTRRLVDVAQDIIVTERDCDTLNGIEVSAIKQGKEELHALRDRVFGRTVCEDIYLPGDITQVLAKAGDLISLKQSEAIDDAGIESVKIRSALTCEAKRGICATCYGLNLATGQPVELGEAVGIIAAQSIGEPGTQLTMRTFHLGGIASAALNPEITAEHEGILIHSDLRTVQSSDGHWIVLNKNGSLHIVRDENRTLEEYQKLLSTKSIEPLQTINLELGTHVLVGPGEKVAKKVKVAQWEKLNIPIICEKPGYVQFDDMVLGISSQTQVNKQTGQVEVSIKQHQGKLQPKIKVFADKELKEQIGSYSLPIGSLISVQDGQFVQAGVTLARLPRTATKTKDITGGLPRVAELFEARRPKDAAEIAKIDGTVHLQGIQKNKQMVVIKNEETGMEEHHHIAMTKHLIVQEGDNVIQGQQLTDGLVVLQEILEICGVTVLQKYLVNQVQEVYRLQGVDINDKHIEIIARQMLQKIRVTNPGDTTLLYGEHISKNAFQEYNRKAKAEGVMKAQAAPELLGITKASLSTESFVSAASFQETTRVLTEAACIGQPDLLKELKSNVIMGQMIPVGTGFSVHKNRHQSIVEKESSEDLDFIFSV